MSASTPISTLSLQTLFRSRPRAQSPTEPLQRVLGKQHEFRNRRGRTRWLGALLQRSEEHTSELQSLRHLVCRLPPEKKNGAPYGATRRTTSGRSSAAAPDR